MKQSVIKRASCSDVCGSSHSRCVFDARHSIARLCIARLGYRLTVCPSASMSREINVGSRGFDLGGGSIWTVIYCDQIPYSRAHGNIASECSCGRDWGENRDFLIFFCEIVI